VRGPDRKFAAGDMLPEIAHVERAGSDSDGFPLVRPLDWPGDGETPHLRLTGTAGDELGEGERALARLVRNVSGEIAAEIIRRVARPEDGANRVVGVFRRTRDGAWIERNTEAGRAGRYRTRRADAESIELYDPQRDLSVLIDLEARQILIKSAGETDYQPRYRIGAAADWRRR